MDQNWRKANSSSSNGACVEVRLFGDVIQVRHSQDPDGEVLSFTKREWIAFIDGAKNDEFDL